MRTEGVKWICSRCGKKEFHPFHPLKTKYPDDKPNEWSVLHNDTIHLCPTCSDKYSDILSHFLHAEEDKPL